MMNRNFAFAWMFVCAVCLLAFTAHKQDPPKKNLYAIQHVQTGKNLRPYEAGRSDGNKIVLYNHQEWKCMTWKFIKVAGDTYRLKNRFTDKTFQPSSAPLAGVTLQQQPMTADALQEWEFIPQPNNEFLIKLKGTDLYVSISSTETNSNIVLMPKQNGAAQLWRLVEQDPAY